MLSLWLLIAAAPLLVAPAAQAACGGVELFRPTDPRRSPPPLAVGDSVMLGAALPLQRAGFEVDVRGCRQMSEGLRVLSSRRRAGSLPSVVVVALGHNWTISLGDIRAGLRILGGQRVLGLVTPRGDRASARRAIRRAGRRWPNRVKVLDWVAHSAGRPWTWDGLHLTSAGARAYTRLLSRAYRWPLPTESPEGGEAPPETGPGGGVGP